MAERKAQVKDIKTYCAFIRKCKKYPWVFKTPLKYAEKFFHRNHTTYALGKYYGAVLSELGIVQDKLLCYYAAELIEKCGLYRNLYETQLVVPGK